ncbi:MAG: tetratricopeptide repeat protein [Candidatus Omnitrophica bacterium]|nr:tetratricopeptide repeat protein [Candidatus Omnitrophota bacterium]
MINLWAMERINRKRFIRVSLVCLVILFLLPFLNISHIYAGKETSVSSDAEAYRTKGYDAQQRGDIDTAIEWYQKAANLMPDYASPHNDLGILFESKGWLDRAESEYEKALAIDSGYKEVHTNMALLYERKGELEKAAFHWMRRYKLGSPEDPWTQEAKNRLEKLGLIDKGAIKTAQMAEQKQVPSVKPKYKGPVKKETPARKVVEKKQKPEARAKKSSNWTRVGGERNKKSAQAVSEKERSLDKELQESLRLAEERLKKEKSGKTTAAPIVKRQPKSKAVTAGELNTSYGKAKDFYNKGEYAKALDSIRIAKQSSPDNKQLLKLEETIKLKMKEERIEDHYKEGMIRYRQKEFAGARKEFEAILNILPE